ncbi:MAG TPA: RNA polymerase sigma factor [Candidatus Angelobacter sp.]|nr:RNA polymerase sigma factor [Candidatus Angelobacter sp.]
MVTAGLTGPSLADEEVVQTVLAGDTAMFEILMRRHNQRLYRVARAILRDDAEAEDLIQDTYVRAYQHLNQFEGRAKFSTWLTRIAVNEALARKHRLSLHKELDPMSEQQGEKMDRFASTAPSPEQQASSSETLRILERAVAALPEIYRTVFVLRDVEDMDTGETATVLNISEENVKTRLHRARALLRKKLYAQAGAYTREAFSFGAARCDRVVRNVFLRIREAGSHVAG